ncbi:hypothetical protein BU16DRAFT_532452 [Lophium mytilinum]|uniref:Uncharacterized protein n=1 Tax=Lophium mytilinum TaxID=390894 RepID=A0A6A6RBE4_9PEZI|nr:hypothetical protein BU16DRAFT_532452 [Lophium mytilinum]
MGDRRTAAHGSGTAAAVGVMLNCRLTLPPPQNFSVILAAQQAQSQSQAELEGSQPSDQLQKDYFGPPHHHHVGFRYFGPEEEKSGVGFFSLPRELRDQIYEESATNGGLAKVLWTDPRKRKVIVENTTDPALTATLSALQAVHPQVAGEAPERAWTYTTPLVDDSRQFLAFKKKLDTETVLGEPKLSNRVKSVAFRRLAGPYANRAMEKLLGMKKLKKVFIVPKKVPRAMNARPDAYRRTQTAMINQLFSSPAIVRFCQDLLEKQKALSFDANLDKAFEKHEKTRARCRALPMGGRLGDQVRMQQAEELNELFAQERNQAMRSLYSEQIEADTEELSSLKARTRAVRHPIMHIINCLVHPYATHAAIPPRPSIFPSPRANSYRSTMKMIKSHDYWFISARKTGLLEPQTRRDVYEMQNAQTCGAR